MATVNQLSGVIKYGFDGTAADIKNKVENEKHSIGVGGPTARVLRFDYAPFYQKTEVIKDLGTGRTLVLGEDYWYSSMSAAVAEELGKGASDACIIVNPNVSADLVIESYQTVGGVFTITTSTMDKIIELLQKTDTPVYWADIIGKDKTFNPTPHMHSLRSLFGYDGVIAALDRINQSILYGDELAHKHILSSIETAKEAMARSLQDHMNQTFGSGVHGLQKAKQDDVVEMSRDDLIVTPASLKKFYDVSIRQLIKKEASVIGQLVIVADYTQLDTNTYLPAEGISLNVAQYPELFQRWGYMFGGSGNTFKSPDLRGLFLRHVDNGRGFDPNRGLGTFQGDAMRRLTGVAGRDQDGSIFTGVYGKDTWTANAAYRSGGGFYISFDNSRLVPTAHEERPVNFAVRFYFKHS